MQFFIAVSVLLIVATAYLVQQFRHRAFVSDQPLDEPAAEDPLNERKAA